MEYLHHLILVFVPGMIILPVVVLFVVVLVICYCPRDFIKYLMNEVVKVILGEQFLKHTSPIEDTNNDDESDPERHRSRIPMTPRRRRKWCSLLVVMFLAINLLWWIVVIWWILLVEQITVNKCVTGADCFMMERYNSRIQLNPDRIINCSNYSLTDGMMLYCYKAGFYFLDACAKAGGVLAIISTTVKLYIPTIIACAKGKKNCFRIAGVITGCVGVLLIVAYVLLLTLLPSDSDLLDLMSGTSGVQFVPLFFVVLLMPIATYTMSAQYHTEYEELPEN